jgi:hypothetical protein
LTVTQDQKAAFAARMERIQKGGVNTNRTIFFGMDEAVPLPKGGAQKAVAKRAAKSPWAKKAKRRGSAKGLVLALILGALAFPAALLAMLHPAAGLDALSAPLPGGPLGAGLALALVTSFIIGLRRPAALVAAACGTLAMAAGFHNLVHAAPDLVAQVFPQTWVNTTLAETRMGTLRPLTEFLTL